MKFEEYVKERERIFSQQKTNKETMNINWGSLSLSGEIGEFCNIVKKIMRDDDGVITSISKLQMKDELGDIFWYLLFVCDILKIKPEEIFDYNLHKLKKRYNIE